MQWPRRAARDLALGLARVLAAAAAGAQALIPQEPGAFTAKPKTPRLIFEVTVLHASPSPGGIDPGAERFDRLLRDTVRYESLRVVNQATEGEAERDRAVRSRRRDFRFRRSTPAAAASGFDRLEQDPAAFRLPRGKPHLRRQPYGDGDLVILEAE
jgi:hypothetical protein